MQDAWQGKIIYYALGDAKINVGSNTLWHALTVVAICKIGVNSIGYITNGISLWIGNSIARNKYIPNDIVKSSANSILT